MKRIVMLSLAVIIAFFLSGNAEAGSTINTSNPNWQYYRNITLNNSGNPLSNYQVLVNLTGSSFPVNAQVSGADIRFLDASGTELSYWIERWDHANRSARIWVNVTSISANDPATGLKTVGWSSPRLEKMSMPRHKLW